MSLLVNRISFSSLSDFQYCPWYYKLVHIDKLKKFEATNYSYWGTLIHKYVQDVLAGKISKKAAGIRIKRTWNKYCSLYKQNDTIKSWAQKSDKILETIQEVLEGEFGKFKILKIEENLYNKTEYRQYFKGFIDIVLLTEDKKIVIADFKTCDSTFMFNRFRDKYKDYQLTLYKYYYSLKHNEPLENIETYFITLERNKSAKKPIKVIRVTAGPKKINNATSWLETALRCIDREFFLKKRTSCHKYAKAGIDEKNTCVFLNTVYCTK